MPNSTILLCFSDTGGGHRSATEAIEAALTELLAEAGAIKDISIVSDNVAEKTHPINRAFVDFYNFLLRHNQASMKYYFWFIHFLKPNDSKFGYSISAPYMKKILRDVDPKVVISIHPMINHYLAKAIKDIGMQGEMRLLTVVTDPNAQLWRGWGCEDSDLTIVPNQITYDKLLEWGIKPEKLKIVGIPLHPEFVKPCNVEPSEFRRNLGLAHDRFTLCLNAGWAGGGNMLAIYKALDKVKRPIQVIFLCGHNQRLYQKVLKQSSTSMVPTAVLPFHDRLADLMPAVDLMVTKAGGLTTYEAVARRLFMAIDTITPPMPQESGTIDILVDNRLARRVSRPSDIIDIIESAPQERPDYLSGPLPKAQSLDRADAAYDIARLVLEYFNVNSSHAPRVLNRSSES